ncbi:MAG TPA: endonuclease/exonuclease/phosphatase family protein [Bacteroidales bacterium]|nr:endonuclease/exonuclease/phosphatase family protein [Bacteroidales bacterium]
MILLIFIPYASYCQDEERALRTMFLNAENAFDTFNDPATDDDDFTTSGVRRWNNKRYYRKIDDLHKTIIAAGEWSSPDIVALCEIENRKVLYDLATGTYLAKYNYSIVHEDSPDSRGIDVCLIYRTDRLKLIHYEYWKPPENDTVKFNSRNVLHASFECYNDTFHIIVNHWPSRRGGVLVAEDLRLTMALLVRHKVDSILKQPGGSKIILVGDFNSTPDDDAIVLLAEKDLVNLSSKIASSNEGTYRYSGVWETIDQVIISEYFLKCKSGLYAERNSMRIFKPDFLLVKDPVYPGLTPFSTYRGFRYQGGISDHLPVLLDLFLH